jgi:hypothetical protein
MMRPPTLLLALAFTLSPAPARADSSVPGSTDGAACANGSRTDCNPRGATLRPGSAFVDPSPPAGWVQCAGFKNTRGDDVNDHFADQCLRATRLRLRVFGPDGKLEEDVYVPVMTPWAAWPDMRYLAGDHRGGGAVVLRSTYWTANDQLAFFTRTDGVDSCGKRVAPGGLVFGTGWCDNLVIVAGSTDAGEYRVSNNGPSLPDRSIALYR